MGMNAHDDRSANPFSGRVTFSMGSDTNVRAYSSEGGAALVIDNKGGNGFVGMGVQGAGGIKNAQAQASDQMGLTNTPTNGNVPSNVVKECASYSLPDSCGGHSNDSAIEKSAADRVPSGGQLDPNFRNPDLAAETITTDKGVNTSLKYSGDVNDDLVTRAAGNWNGDGVNITPARQPDGSGLQIFMRSSRELADDLCLANCLNGYSLGGRTDNSTGTIYLNRDHTISIQRTSLTHELGHYFLGNDHPQKPGEFLFGGIMDYRHPVSDAERQQYRNAYQTPAGTVP